MFEMYISAHASTLNKLGQIWVWPGLLAIWIIGSSWSVMLTWFQPWYTAVANGSVGQVLAGPLFLKVKKILFYKSK